MMENTFEEYHKQVGLKVAYYRKLRGITQEQLAEKMGCDTSFIGQIEAPNIAKGISLDTLFRIAKALEVQPYRFLYFDN